VTRSEILEWAAHYDTRIEEGVLDQFNEEFNRRNGRIPIIGEVLMSRGACTYGTTQVLLSWLAMAIPF